jgi:hypothetical protein
MRTAKCPMCQGESFHTERVKHYSAVGISLGPFSLRGRVPVGYRVCLSCGFVAPYVNHSGLVAIRKKAKGEVIEIDEEPHKDEMPEL